MNNALRNIVSAKTTDEKEVEMSIVEKESDLGLSFNKRLFVLIDSTRFAYFSKFKIQDDPSKIDLKSAKAEGIVKNINKLDQNKNILKIQFWVKNKAKKRQEKLWTLKMDTEELAIIWLNKLNQLKHESNIRKSQSPFKGNSKSPSKSQLMKESKSKTDFHENYNVGERPFSRSDLKNNTKLESQKPKEGPREQFRNPFYEGTPTIQEKSDEDRLDEMQRQNETKRKEYLEAERRREIERQEEELLREREIEREREKQRMERQKQISERNRQMEKWRKKQQKPKKKDQILIQSEEPLNENFFKPKSSIKEEEVKKVNLKTTKSKQKLNNVDYFDMVSKIVSSSDSPYKIQKDKKDLEKAHDQIFQIEKMRMQRSKEDRNKILKRNQESLKVSSEYGWTYRYLIKQTEGQEFQVVCEFNSYCEKILRSVISQFEFPQRKRSILPKYKRKQYYLYEIEDIQFKVAILDLKQVYSEEEPGNRDRICDMGNVKKLQNQFKNFYNIYKASDRKSIVKIPLICLCQYKGFIALFKATSLFDKQVIPSNNIDRNVEACLQSLSEKCKADLQALKSRQNTMLLKLNGKYYNELALQIGRGHLKFDYHMLQEIKYLMPPDYLYLKKNKAPYNSKIDYEEKQENQAFLRQELLQSYLQKNQTIQSLLFMSLKKQKVSSKLPKTLRNSQNQNAKLEQLSQNVLASITAAIHDFDHLNFYFMHPTELSEFLHRKGVNMRYLGYLYEYTELPFMRSCLISEIAGRTCKILFRKTIQDIHFQEDSSENVGTYDENILDKIIDFLNCILGNSIETVTIWKVLSAHSLKYFNVPLRPDSVQKGVFIISIIYHCGIAVNWPKIDVNDVFQTPTFFHPDNLIDIKPRIKSLPPVFTQKEELLLKGIQRQDPQIYMQLVKEYDLERKKFPQHIKQSQHYEKILKYLANFIPPEQFEPQEPSFSHLKIYSYEGCPTKYEFSRELLELKWYLQKRKKQKYIRVFNSLLTKVNTFYGDFHPLLSQLYETFCIFHRNNAQYEDSITFCKSSVVNMLKICGANHIKIGQCYYQLALCCIKSAKKEQAILNLKKAKNIFEGNKKTDTVSYAFVTLKLGLLFLSENKIKESQNIVEYSIKIFEKMAMEEGEFQDDIVEGYEILGRCYEIQQAKGQEKELGRLCTQKLQSIKNASNLQKIMKLALYPLFNRLPYQKASIYLEIINKLPFEINTDSYIKSYEFLKARINERTFIENLNSYIENLEHIENYLQENSTLDGWVSLKEMYERETVNDFLSLTEELMYFLGEGFVSGALRESL